MDCLFCKIVRGDIPNFTVYEDDHTLAFLDIHPLSKGHTIVIPKKHGGTILDFSGEEMERFFSVVQSVAGTVKEAVGSDGFTVGINDEISQDVPHLHLHVIPRWKGDGGGSIHKIKGIGGEVAVEEVHKLFG